MKATITNSKTDNKLRNKSVVYVNWSALDKVADQWFGDNSIMNLNFKCKTWSQVAGLVTKTTAPLLRDLFPEALSIKFSRTAGCRCGCSPGYIMEHELNQRGRNFWVDIEVTPEEVEAFTKKVYGSQYRQSLEKEIKDHSMVG